MKAVRASKAATKTSASNPVTRVESDLVEASGPFGWERLKGGLAFLKRTFSPQKMDGWNTLISYWGGLFPGANC